MERSHPDNDLQLFLKVKNENDRSAFNELFSFYYKRLVFFATNFIKDTDQAEEVVSDVFFYLWKNRGQLDIQSSVKSYLYTCVRNGCINVFKKQRQPLDSLQYVDTSSMADLNDPEKILALRELKGQIDAIVNILPEKCRVIFIMSRYEGLKYREIAQILGIAEKTVENQLVKAITILRVALSGDAGPVSGSLTFK